MFLPLFPDRADGSCRGVTLIKEPGDGTAFQVLDLHVHPLDHGPGGPCEPDSQFRSQSPR
jgi:hypothetical protein